MSTEPRIIPVGHELPAMEALAYAERLSNGGAAHQLMGIEDERQKTRGP